MHDRRRRQKFVIFPLGDSLLVEGATYRVGAELAAEPAATAAELVQLPPASSVVGGVAWRALCCGWLRG